MVPDKQPWRKGRVGWGLGTGEHKAGCLWGEQAALPAATECRELPTGSQALLSTPPSAPSHGGS